MAWIPILIGDGGLWRHSTARRHRLLYVTTDWPQMALLLRRQASPPTGANHRGSLGRPAAIPARDARGCWTWATGSTPYRQAPGQPAVAARPAMRMAGARRRRRQ